MWWSSKPARGNIFLWPQCAGWLYDPVSFLMLWGPRFPSPVVKRRDTKTDQLPLSSTWVVVQGAVDLHATTHVHCMAITHTDNFKLYTRNYILYFFVSELCRRRHTKRVEDASRSPKWDWNGVGKEQALPRSIGTWTTRVSRKTSLHGIYRVAPKNVYTLHPYIDE
jgi:hypothetical protein